MSDDQQNSKNSTRPRAEALGTVIKGIAQLNDLAASYFKNGKTRAAMETLVLAGRLADETGLAGPGGSAKALAD